ncbi:MAG TPA: NADP-dependent oxidoreductase [Anaerolineales bacterium]|nr:NADP-dependent oxidoreductase [Anaerolineales bacterium]
MDAIRLHTATGAAGLVHEHVEPPKPRDAEVLVRVHAAAITRDELDWPAHRLPAIPSYEFSGVIAEIGEKVDDLAVGDEVYALSPFDRDGAAAEYIAIQNEFLAPKPRTIDHIQSASIPLAALTAWQGLFVHGQLRKDQRVLVHGATGGVGHFAVQLAHQCGAFVIGTVSTRNIEAARKLGVDKIVDTTTTQFEDVVADVDLVFDTVGGDRLQRSPATIRRDGILISVATEPPRERANALGIKSLYFVVSPNREQLIEIAKFVDEGVLEPIVDRVFPLSRAKEAFEQSLLHHGAGKIVLRVVEE